MEVPKEDTYMLVDATNEVDVSGTMGEATDQPRKKRKREELGNKEGEKEATHTSEKRAKGAAGGRGMTETFTITLGDQAENHAGMQVLGTFADEGFELEDLMKAKAWFEERGVKVTIHHLNPTLSAARKGAAKKGKKSGKEEGEEKEEGKESATQDDETKDAYVLIAEKGLNAIVDADAFHAEQGALDKDKKAFMYGRVVNKHARHNLCFAEQAQDPDYKEGKGRVVAFDAVPLLKKLRATLPEILGDKAADLMAEGNYYYDISKCGIGFHGDGERRKVVAVRTGAAIPLHYQWFYHNKPVGERIKFVLGHGDFYVMSEKASGNDWKRRNSYTLRHAAGATKFLALK